VASARSNGIWAVAQQLTTVGLSGLFAIALIRVLPVADYGHFSYATTLGTLGAAVMTGGLQTLAVRELRLRERGTRTVMSSVIVVRELIALAVYILFVAYSAAFAGSGTVIPTAVACVSVLARVFDAPELYFQSELKTKTPALIRMSVSIAFFVARISAIFLGGSVILFVALFALEYVVATIVIGVVYKRETGNPIVESPNWEYTRSIARQASPLALSGVANQINLRVDVILLQSLSGATSVGLYSAAARISEILYIVPTAYMGATFPSLVDLKKSGDKSAYRRALEWGFSGAFYAGIMVALLIYFLSDWIVALLFGDAYELSANVLKIHVFACPFVFMAAVLSKWIVAEGVLWASFVRHFSGAAIAIVLNILLIPTFGIVGSAWATLCSYAAASYFFCFFSKSTLSAAWMMSKAPAVPVLYLISRMRGKEG